MPLKRRTTMEYMWSGHHWSKESELLLCLRGRLHTFGHGGRGPRYAISDVKLRQLLLTRLDFGSNQPLTGLE